jgi:Methyltransferase FkbM domain
MESTLDDVPLLLLSRYTDENVIYAIAVADAKLTITIARRVPRRGYSLYSIIVCIYMAAICCDHNSRTRILLLLTVNLPLLSYSPISNPSASRFVKRRTTRYEKGIIKVPYHTNALASLTSIDFIMKFTGRSLIKSRLEQSISGNLLSTIAFVSCSGLVFYWMLFGAGSTTNYNPLLLPSAAGRQRRDWSKFQYHPPLFSDPTSRNETVCGPSPTFESFWTLDEDHRSSSNEDKTIYEMFFKRTKSSTTSTSSSSATDSKRFRYLELGAFDGVRESNTRFYDECLGWDGLLIEPNPKIFPRLVRNRPHAHRMSYAASCSEAQEAANATVTFLASWFTNAAQNASINRGDYEGRDDLLTEVPCGSLTPVILDLFPDGHVDFFSLDTEGTEHFIMRQVDLSRISFDVIIAENDNRHCQQVCESRNQTRIMLQAAGYTLDTTTIERSDLYMSPRMAKSRKDLVSSG